jgi:glycosyltransferase involved in cell wall biosynthesis
VDGFYRRAHCYCSTSNVEGFPNTYLEAWSHGIPVAALADPDGLIGKRHLGVAATSVDGLVAGIRQLLDDQRHWLAVSANARDYYLGRHTVDAAMSEFERVLQMEAMKVVVSGVEAGAR